VLGLLKRANLNQSINQSFEPDCGLGVHSASNRNKYQKMSPGSRARPTHKADNLTSIYEQTV
jgi:hypothetical protein